MESTERPAPTLIEQAQDIIHQYALTKVPGLGIDSIQKNLEEMDAKISKARETRFAGMEESQFYLWLDFSERFETRVVSHLKSAMGSNGMDLLLACYSEIQTQYRQDLIDIQNVFIDRVGSSREASVRASPHVTPISERQIGLEGYEKAYEDLKAHLRNLANPVLVENLINAFQHISKRSVNGRDSLLPHFTILPKDTKQVLEEFDRQIKSRCRTDSVNKLENTLKVINDNVMTLAKLGVPKIERWLKLDNLLSLDEILTLENDIIKEILYRIKQGQPSPLRTYVREKLKQSHVDLETLDATLQSMGLFDLNTLLAQTIKTRPKESSGIVTHWNQPVEFFREKSLIFGATPNIGNPSGQILQCSRDTNQDLLFRLDTDFLLRVSLRNSDYIVTVAKQLNYRLLNMILRNDTDAFELAYFGGSQQTHGIPVGCYQLNFTTSSFWFESKRLLATLIHTQDQSRYRIYQSTDKSGTEVLSVYAINKKKKEKHLETMGRSEFLNTFEAKKSISSKPFIVDREKCERLVVIKESVNEARIKAAQRKIINATLDVIRTALLEKHNETLLLRLTDNLIVNRLERIDVDAKALPPTVSTSLEEVSELFAKHFDTVRPPHQILKQIVLEAIYTKVEIKPDSLIVANAMTLLQQAHIHTEKLEGLDGVLVMGETGSGKSASIAYALGAFLEEAVSRASDPTFVLSPRRNKDLSIYPSIGQSLGMSETLYAQGYRITDPTSPSKGVMLVDCAGFNETRGTEWEICANLSVDEAVKKLRTIRSLVVVCPFSAFTQDRANGFIDLIWTVQDRFPGTFVPGRQESTAVTFIVTKSVETGPLAQRNLRERIEEHITEIDSHLQQFQSREADPEINKSLSLENKKRIWQALQEMQTNDQIHIIDLLDRDERENLLARILQNSSTAIKGYYRPAMDSPKLRKDLGDLIEHSTETWVHLLDQYRNKVPSAIAEMRAEISLKQERLAQLAQEREHRLEQIKQHGEQIVRSEAFIRDLQKARDNPAQMNQAIYDMLQIKEKENAEAALSLLKSELRNFKEKTKDAKKQILQIQQKIKQLETKIGKAESEVTQLRASLEEKPTGDHDDVLWNISYKPNQTINVITLTDEKIKRVAFSEVRSYLDSEIKERKQCNVSDLDGTYEYLFATDREYKLVPADPRLIEEFNRAYKASGAYGTYEAIVEGEHFEPDLGFNALASGKKVVYSFKTKWQRGGPLPRIKVTHRVPNKEFHSVTITNIAAQIERLQEEIGEGRKELGEKEQNNGRHGELAIINDELRTSLEQCKRLRQSIKEVEIKIEETTGRISSRIEVLLANEKKRVQTTINIKAALENSLEIEEKTARTNLELGDLQKSLQAKLHIKRNLAITLTTKWETIRLLRQFADLVLHSGHSEQTGNKRGSGILTVCTAFIEVYDVCKDKLLFQCAEDLKP